MGPSVRYELRHDRSKAQPWYWRVVSLGNWKVLATSETYHNRDDAIHAANLVRQGSAGAEFVDMANAA